jgi:hypothetical protein
MAGSAQEEEKEEAQGETLVLVMAGMAGYSPPKDGVLRTPMSRPSTFFDFALS